MNKRWIEACQRVANVQHRGNRPLERFECLDVMGLFETGWMVYCHPDSGHYFGYPGT